MLAGSAQVLENATQPHLSALSCKAINPSVTDAWCNLNCNNSPPFCPDDMCICTNSGPTPPPTPFANKCGTWPDMCSITMPVGYCTLHGSPCDTCTQDTTQFQCKDAPPAAPTPKAPTPPPTPIAPTPPPAPPTPAPAGSQQLMLAYYSGIGEPLLVKSPLNALAIAFFSPRALADSNTCDFTSMVTPCLVPAADAGELLFIQSAPS